MKFFAGLFGLLVILIVAFILLFYFNENKDDMGRKLNESMSATAVEKTPSPLSSNQNSRQNQAQAHAQAFAQAANFSGTRARIVSQQGNEYSMMIRWSGDRVDLGGVFLDSLIQQGVLEDFQEQMKLHNAFDEDGNRVLQVQYLITMK